MSVRPGNLLIALGIGVVIVGILVRLGWFSWFGHLPGDIRAEGERGGFYLPITSSIVVSLVATLLLNVVARLFDDR
jgi:Zn-dependent protease with chaperone function